MVSEGLLEDRDGFSSSPGRVVGMSKIVTGQQSVGMIRMAVPTVRFIPVLAWLAVSTGTGAVIADHVGAGGPDWASYYAATPGHEPRPLLRAACELLGAGVGRTAIDLGCGSGDDALALLAWGWSVVAVDQEPTAHQRQLGRAPLHELPPPRPGQGPA
jgi:hypothetical protein